MAATNTNNAANVFTGKPMVHGAVWWAPLSDDLTIPTDATTELAEGFLPVGYLSEDGWSNAPSSEFETTKAYGGVTVRRSLSSYEETISFACIETNANVLKLMWGDSNVETELESGKLKKVRHNGTEKPAICLVIETALSATEKKRTVVPYGTVNELEEIPHNDTDPITYGVTIGCLPDAKTGDTVVEYYGTIAAA